MSSPADIVLDRVSFRYAGGKAPAIEDVNLTINAGEFVVLAGRSGCGKTTVARTVNGLIPHFHEGSFEGTAQVAGRDTRELDVGEIGESVGSVFQDPRSQFFMTDATSEVAFGCVNAGLPREQIWRRIDDAFQRLGIERLRDRSVFGLSSGEMQMVAVASCYAMGPSIFVFDEPSANLDMEAIATLRQAMSELKREGKTIVVLEHRLFYLAGLFDRMVVIEDGAVSCVFDAHEAASLDDAELSRMGLRSLRLEAAPQTAAPSRSREATQEPGGALLQVEGLSFSYGRKRNATATEIALPSSYRLGPLSFSARAGEVIGVIGENGAGKTTLSRVCCGLEKEESGVVSLNGKSLFRKERLGRIRLVMQDPDYQLFSDSVLGELSLGGRRDPEACEHALKNLSLWDMKDAHPATLSRGQKRRLTIACALVDDATAYFFDEPTSGLDRENMERVALAIRSLAQDGGIVFAVSHDFEFLVSACDRILRLEAGRIADDFVLDESSCKRLGESLWKGGAQWNDGSGF